MLSSGIQRKRWYFLRLFHELWAIPQQSYRSLYSTEMVGWTVRMKLGPKKKVGKVKVGEFSTVYFRLVTKVITATRPRDDCVRRHVKDCVCVRARVCVCVRVSELFRTATRCVLPSPLRGQDSCVLPGRRYGWQNCTWCVCAAVIVGLLPGMQSWWGSWPLCPYVVSQQAWWAWSQYQAWTGCGQTPIHTYTHNVSFFIS